MSQHLLVLTTIGSEEDAARLGRNLVEKRLVVCVNVIGPARSIFLWKGKVEDESERLLLMKTRADRYVDLETNIKELHPYEIPEIIAIPIERGSQDYLAWVDENVG